MDAGLENLLKRNQQLLRETLTTVNRLSKLTTSVAENHEEQIELLTRLAKHDNGRLDRIERMLEALTLEVDRFVRGQRGNGHRK